MPNTTFVDSGNNVGLFEFYPDYTQDGFYIVRFIASDGQLSDTIHVDLTVNDVNRAPIADAGPDQLAVEAGFLVTLDGSGSYDPDGTIQNYEWDFGDGSTHGGGVGPNHLYNNPGVYYVNLTVTDSQSIQDSNSLIINASDPVVIPLEASSSASPTSGEVPLIVNFSGSATGGHRGSTGNGRGSTPGRGV